MKLASLLGSVLVLALIAYVVLHFTKMFNYTPSYTNNSIASVGVSGGMARLPCLANNHCPMGQKCSGGFCSEGFMSSFTGTTDMSSCGAKECNGINAPCSRTSSPCPEGTFCQGNSCVNIAAPNNGTAYNQIGMLLS